MGGFHAYNYQSIITNTTVSLGGQGTRLFTVNVNDPGATWVITITDGAAGTLVAAIKPTVPVSLRYSAVMSNNITVVTTGTTPGNVTINYT